MVTLKQGYYLISSSYNTPYLQLSPPKLAGTTPADTPSRVGPSIYRQNYGFYDPWSDGLVEMRRVLAVSASDATVSLVGGPDYGLEKCESNSKRNMCVIASIRSLIMI